jgi:transcriptional regulator with XRE-family HTH domain
MLSTPRKQAHDYAERIRARLPRRLQEALEAVPMSKYALEERCGISRQMLGLVESGESVPGLCVMAQMSHGLGLTLTEFARTLEDDADCDGPGDVNQA